MFHGRCNERLHCHRQSKVVLRVYFVRYPVSRFGFSISSSTWSPNTMSNDASLRPHFRSILYSLYVPGTPLYCVYCTVQYRVCHGHTQTSSHLLASRILFCAACNPAGSISSCQQDAYMLALLSQHQQPSFIS